MQTLMRLSALFEERSEAYANANARVSLESMPTYFFPSPVYIKIVSIPHLGAGCDI